MIRNAERTYVCLLFAAVLMCASLQACRARGDGNAEAILGILPDEERIAARDFFHADAPTLMSILYGPEWRTLWIIQRTVEDGTLTATEYRWEGSAFNAATTAFESSVLYTTSDPRSIRIFHDIRRQIEQPGQRIADDPRIVSSNPFWVAHVVPDTGHGIKLPYPWSDRDCEWMAASAALMRASLDPEHAYKLWVRPADGLDLNRGRMYLAPLSREGSTLDTWLGWYVHIALSYFDLEQEYLELLRSGTPIGAPVYEGEFDDEQELSNPGPCPNK